MLWTYRLKNYVGTNIAMQQELVRPIGESERRA